MSPHKKFLLPKQITVFSVFAVILGYAPSNAGGLSQPNDTLTSASFTAGQSGNLTPLSSNYIGKIDSADQTTYEQEFVLTNISKAPVTITQMIPSCSCTRAYVYSPKADREIKYGVDSTPSPDEFVSIAPGAKLHVDVEVNVEGLKPGTFEKNVLVETNPSQPKPIYLKLRYEIPATIGANQH